MKRLAILTAMLAATAIASVPARAQADEPEAPATEAASPEDLAAINLVKVQTLRGDADQLEAELAEVQAFMSDLEEKIAATDESDLNALEMMRMDLRATRLEAGSMEARINALRARADEIEADIPEGVVPLEAPADAAAPVPEDELLVAQADESPEVAPAPRSTTDFLDIGQSQLARILLSDELATDDVAIMGIVSGARRFCGMNWEPGFVEFILLANQNGYDLPTIADEHGLYMGGATKNLRESGYVCVEEDRVGLRTINPF